MEDKIVLEIIKTDKCCFVRKKGTYKGPSITSLIINGETPIKTFESSWYKISSEPKSVKKAVPAEKCNYRQVLMAEKLELSGFSGKTLGSMRPEIPREECMYSDGYEWYWKSEYEHLSSMYELKYDTINQEPEDVEFEVSVFCTIPSLEEYSGMSYEVFGYLENSDPHRRITDANIGRRQIDKILYPPIFYPSCTAIMSSENLYKIIRFHVKQNIDHRYAKITSDNNFCFEVKKRILPKDTYECLKITYGNISPPKKKHELSTVFEMTHDKHNYGGYTVLPKMEAKNNKALKRKIDRYLKELMKHINKPAILCPHCEGRGILDIKKFQHPQGDEK